MKTIVKAAVLGVALLGASLSATAANIAVVNLSEVFQQAPQKARIEKQLQQEFQGRVAELKRIEDAIRASAEKQKKDAQLMTAEQRTQGLRKLEEMQADYQLKAKALDEDNRRRQAEERQKLLESMEGVIRTIAEQKGYEVVIQASAVVYAKDTVDITAQVIQGMSKK